MSDLAHLLDPAREIKCLTCLVPRFQVSQVSFAIEMVWCARPSSRSSSSSSSSSSSTSPPTGGKGKGKGQVVAGRGNGGHGLVEGKGKGKTAIVVGQGKGKGVCPLNQECSDCTAWGTSSSTEPGNVIKVVDVVLSRRRGPQVDTCTYHSD